MNTKQANGAITSRGWVMLTLLVFLLPLVTSNYLFHDDLWMLGWGENPWMGRDLACGQSNLFWGSYFMDGRFFAAFTADCVVKPAMNWVSDHGNLSTAQHVIVGFRVLSLLFLSLFVWQTLKLLEATPSSPIATAVSMLSVVMLPGVLFMILWGHAAVFNVSFLFVAIFILAFRQGLAGTLAGPWYLLFVITLIISFLGYGLYTITGLYVVIPVVLYLALAENFEWGSREEKTIRSILLGVIAAAITFAIAQKASSLIFSEHASANAKVNIAHMGIKQLAHTIASVLVHLLRPIDAVSHIAYLWFIPDGYLSDRAANLWAKISGFIMHICLFTSIWLLIRKKDNAYPNIRPRLFYLLAFFVLSYAFIVLSQSVLPRVIIVAQAAYLALAIALLRHFIHSRANVRFKHVLGKTQVIFIAMLLVFMNWYILNSMLLISAREEGELTSMLYALKKGEVSSVTVHWPNPMVPPDSFGPSILFNNRVKVLADYILASPQGKKNHEIAFRSDLKTWFQFRNRGVVDKPEKELYFDAREMLPRADFRGSTKINPGTASSVLINKPQLTMSSFLTQDFQPDSLSFGSIWHAEINPKYPQWVKVKFDKALSGTSLLLWQQEDHASRFPYAIVVRGYRDGKEIGHFQTDSHFCIPSRDPLSISLAPLGAIDAVRLDIQSNCGDAQYLSIGRLEIQ